ncbi:LuxR family transcriptional regulator [Geovibrio thiophilus]|uniref:LuxR family transcriptional regulator n=1 Tax=Geovibrio thiophilus TaxID=139438 RepID=A0A3R5Y7M8_9BACT|nr:LuxR family transcriptional regulator [Geovibrio thiophilus]QAR33689.1 LuxR family transcriptional regulator [Geovibrio thiophilus]
MICTEETLNSLSRKDLTEALCFMDDCLKCENDREFDSLLRDFGSYLGFEYVLCCYMHSTYRRANKVNILNISNPAEWMDEYEKENYVQDDPVRYELEQRLSNNETVSFIHWDEYERSLSPKELQIIERRRHYGLNYGCSVYTNSQSKDFTFLISLADKEKEVDRRTEILSTLLIQHMMNAKKRLDTTALVNALTKREKSVADWILDGKTNWEIAAILNISENTVKYHVKNIYIKLKVSGRQEAIAVMLAVRYLSL